MILFYIIKVPALQTDMDLTTNPKGWRHKVERFSVKNAFLVFAIVSFLFAFALASIISDSSVVGLGRELGSVGVFGVVEIILAVFIGRHFARRAESVVKALNHLSKGDLTLKLKLNGRDDFAWLAYEYDCARRSLVDLITDLSQHASNVSAYSTQLAGDSQEISHSTRQQSEAASSIASAIEEMAASVSHVADNARHARDLTSETGEASQAGTGVIGKVVQEVTNIAQAVQSSSTVIEDLGNQSEQIRSIVKVINEVAEQTNLLALNAAIEAARAGEQGRGFAVVADEVRKLAERTATSSREIGSMIEAISAGTTQAVESMQQGVSKVENGVRLAQEAGTTITAIDASTQQVVATVSDITTAIEEQRTATNEIARHVERIAQMAESNSDSTRRTGETATQLSALSSELQSSVARFKL